MQGPHREGKGQGRSSGAGGEHRGDGQSHHRAWSTNNPAADSERQREGANKRDKKKAVLDPIITGTCSKEKMCARAARVQGRRPLLGNEEKNHRGFLGRQR